MLQIHRSAVKNAKKFAVFNLCLILNVITLCNIFALNCFADETDPTASATEVTSQSKENSIESITEPTEISTEDITEPSETPTELESSSDDDYSMSDSDSIRFYFLIVIIILLIMMFLSVLRMVI